MAAAERNAAGNDEYRTAHVAAQTHQVRQLHDVKVGDGGGPASGTYRQGNQDVRTDSDATSAKTGIVVESLPAKSSVSVYPLVYVLVC